MAAKTTPYSSSGGEPSPPPSPKDEREESKERQIPFLRQLTDMLQNNSEIISFVPGERLPSGTTHGRIVVHDRHRLQASVLPVYFNHASFASLRRQLSYFSFVRVGKSRQSGVTYTNDAVVELGDILRLKRRGVGQSQAGAAIRGQKRKPQGSSSGASPPPLPPPATNREIQLATTSADVASAVLSGTLHAAKTNHNLDTNGATVLEEAAAPRSSATGNTSSATQSSISQSLESSSSDEGGSAQSGKKLNTACVAKKKKSYKRRCAVKHPVRGKDRARLDRLLSINNIVPFIHLPSPPKRASPAMARRDEINATSKEEVKLVATKFQKESSGKGREMRERSDSGAVHAQALLALGADRQ